MLPVQQHGWVSLRQPPGSASAAEAAKQLEGFLADFQLSAAPPDVAWVAVHGKSMGGLRHVEHWDIQASLNRLMLAACSCHRMREC